MLARYLLPQPRNALAEAVRAHASGAMDVSDGLAGDLAKLCRVSGVARRRSRLPMCRCRRPRAPRIAAEPAMLETALTGGDDYEIVCTVPAGEGRELPRRRQGGQRSGYRDRRRSLQARAPASLEPDGKALAFKHASFSHF